MSLPLHPRLARQLRRTPWTEIVYLISAVWLAVGIYFATCPAQADDINLDLGPIIAALLDLTKTAPNRTPIHRSEKHRIELATAFASAGEKYDIDPLLLVALAFAESSLRVGVIGAKGELGLMQVMPSRASLCDVATVRGQVECGAVELRKAIDLCGGDVAGGIARYASGRTCAWSEEREPGLHRVVAKRLAILERIKEATP